MDKRLDQVELGCCVTGNREFKKTTTATATGMSLNKGLMSKTIAVHVRYDSLYISLSSSAKQQRQMTKFCVVQRTSTRQLIYFLIISACLRFHMMVLTKETKENDLEYREIRR